jgi:hypothetical protein
MSSARLPLKLLQQFAQQAKDKADNGPDNLSQVQVPESSHSISSSRPTTGIPEATPSGTSPKAPTRFKEPDKIIDHTTDAESEYSGSSLEEVSWPPTPSQELRGRLPPDSSDERTDLTPSKSHKQKEQSVAVTRSSTDLEESARINLDLGNLQDGAKEIPDGHYILDSGQEPRVSRLEQEANPEKASSQLEDGLGWTLASQEFRTSVMHEASPQLDFESEFSAMPEPIDNHFTSQLTRHSQSDDSYQLLNDAKAESEKSSTSFETQNIQTGPSAPIQSNLEASNNGSDDEISADTELEMAVPISLNQELGIEEWKRRDLELQPMSSQYPEGLQESQQENGYHGFSSSQAFKATLEHHLPKYRSRSSPLLEANGRTLLEQDHQIPLVRMSPIRPSRSSQYHQQLSQESLYDEQMIHHQLSLEIQSSQTNPRSQHPSPSAVPIYEQRHTRSTSPRYSTPLRGMISRRSITTTSKSSLPLLIPRKRKSTLTNEEDEHPKDSKRHRVGTIVPQARGNQMDGFDDTVPASIQQFVQEDCQAPNGSIVSRKNAHRLQPRKARHRESRSEMQQLNTNMYLITRPSFQQPSVYQKFRATYSDFQAPIDRFVMPCFLLEQRAQAGRPIHKFLWDDYVGRFSSDCEKWSYGISFDDYYDEFVEEPSYTKRVLNHSTLQEALMLDPKTVELMQSRYSKAQKSVSRSDSGQTTPILFPEISQQVSPRKREVTEAGPRVEHNQTCHQSREIQDSLPSSTRNPVRSLKSSLSPLHLKAQDSIHTAQYGQLLSLAATPDHSPRADINAASTTPQSDMGSDRSGSSERSDIIPASFPHTLSKHASYPGPGIPFGSPEIPHRSEIPSSSSSSEFPPLSILLGTQKAMSQTGKYNERAEAKVLAKNIATSQESPQINQRSKKSLSRSQQSRLPTLSSSTPPSGQQSTKITKQSPPNRLSLLQTPTAPQVTRKDLRTPMFASPSVRVDPSESQRRPSLARLPIEPPSLRRVSGSGSRRASKSRLASAEMSKSRATKEEKEEAEPCVPQLFKPISKTTLQNPADLSQLIHTQPQPQAQWWQDHRTPFKDYVRNCSKLRSEHGRLGVVCAETGLLIPPSSSFPSSAADDANVTMTGKGRRVDVLSWRFSI